MAVYESWVSFSQAAAERHAWGVAPRCGPDARASGCAQLPSDGSCHPTRTNAVVTYSGPVFRKIPRVPCKGDPQRGPHLDQAPLRRISFAGVLPALNHISQRTWQVLLNLLRGSSQSVFKVEFRDVRISLTLSTWDSGIAYLRITLSHKAQPPGPAVPYSAALCSRGGLACL